MEDDLSTSRPGSTPTLPTTTTQPPGTQTAGTQPPGTGPVKIPVNGENKSDGGKPKDPSPEAG